MKKIKIQYYTDPLKDDFSGITKKTITVDKNYKYIRKNPIWKFCSWIIYYIFIRPFAFIHCKLKFRYKIINKKALKIHKNQGYFVYCNHTLTAGDAFFPSIVNYPHKPYIVVNADNVSTWGTKNIVMMLGALPIPTKIDGMKNFREAIEKRFVQNHPIIIYPEAHLWPYYTKIRPFTPTSFRYPAELNSPVYSCTTTFSKSRFRKTPKVTLFIDGPFYPNKTNTIKENQQQLRDQVYNCMVERCKNSTYEVIKYEQRTN